MTPGLDTRGENPLEHIYQEEIPQLVRRSTQHAALVNRLEPTIRWKTYQANHLIMQTVESNGRTIENTTEEATVLGHICPQTYSLTKGINKFGDKGLDAVLAEVK